MLVRVPSAASVHNFGASTWQKRTVRPLKAFPRDDAAPEPQQTVQEQIFFFTDDGVVKIPGRLYQVPRKPKLHQPMPSWEEQTLCIGQTFQVAAWNARDPSRRINFLGFCQSVDLLHESVEETVTSRGGEILEQERKLKSGLHEQLKLTVVIPYLWGVPPEVELLSAAILQGGGIVDKVYKQWGIGTMHPSYLAGSWQQRGSSSTSC